MSRRPESAEMIGGELKLDRNVTDRVFDVDAYGVNFKTWSVQMDDGLKWYLMVIPGRVGPGFGSGLKIILMAWHYDVPYPQITNYQKLYELYKTEMQVKIRKMPREWRDNQAKNLKLSVKNLFPNVQVKFIFYGPLPEEKNGEYNFAKLPHYDDDVVNGVVNRTWYLSQQKEGLRIAVQTMLSVLNIRVSPETLRDIIMYATMPGPRDKLPLFSDENHAEKVLHDIEERGGNSAQKAKKLETKEHLESVEQTAATLQEVRRAHEKYKPGGDGYLKARNEYMRLEDFAAAARLLRDKGGGIDELIAAMERMIVE